jgi:ABC-type polysaccharide/polyol phosphate export systems, permease component
MTYLFRLWGLLSDIGKSRRIIYELTKNDVKSKYLGSYLGIVWAFFQPLVTIIILWFVFSVGFKSMPVENLPFILWLIAGMIPWFFITDSIASATNSIIENSYLVKKVVFRVSILPVIKILSALFIHLFFILVLFIFFIVYGYSPTVYWLQVGYYLAATIALVFGISLITASLAVFTRDVGQVVAMVIQFGFWATPIFWPFKMLPAKYLPLVKLNPFFYIVDGYRDCLINKVWFWEHPGLAIYFWLVAGSIFLLGAVLFIRLRPHFADVL